MNILAISAHPDDMEIGCGGSIARFLKAEHTVKHIVLNQAELTFPADAEVDRLPEIVAAANCLDDNSRMTVMLHYFPHRQMERDRQKILDLLIKYKRHFKPDLVFIPSGNDLHQDHQVTHNEAVRAFKDTKLVGYELLWNTLIFQTQMFVRLTKGDVIRKISAIRKYESQKIRSYLDAQFIESWARTRGMQIGTEFAEAFEVIRWVL